MSFVRAASLGTPSESASDTVASPTTPSACRLDARISTCAHKRAGSQRDGARRGVDDVLAIVEDDERSLRAQREHEILERVAIARAREAERLRNRGGNVVAARERRELDEPYAVDVPIEQIRRHLQRRSRLADAARTDEREQAMPLDERDDFGDLPIATDERTQLQRQVVRKHVERSQGRKLRGEIRCDRLIHVFRLREIAETIARRDRATAIVGGNSPRTISAVTPESIVCRPCADRDQPRDAIDGEAEVVAVAFFGRSR